jgi:carbon-monoxide dehydrogenase medium subunit
MKLPPFELVLATSSAQAVAALAADEGAKVLAGGQSLVPLLALRLARPSVLVDVNGIGLDGISDDGDEVVLGALVRHRQLERQQVVPLLAKAAAHIGHAAIRHRGTLGGSLAHADPAAELPAALLALEGAVIVEGPGGRRRIAAADLFDGFLTTTASPDELVVEVRVPRRAARTAFCEWAPRAGDFAHAGVALVLGEGWVRASACGVASQPVDLSSCFEPVLEGASEEEVRARVEVACAGDDDRAALAGLLAVRALGEAA